MERREKESSLSCFNLAYSQITKYSPYPYLNLFLLLLQYGFFLAQFSKLVGLC